MRLTGEQLVERARRSDGDLLQDDRVPSDPLDVAEQVRRQDQRLAWPPRE